MTGGYVFSDALPHKTNWEDARFSMTSSAFLSEKVCFLTEIFYFLGEKNDIIGKLLTIHAYATPTQNAAYFCVKQPCNSPRAILTFATTSTLNEIAGGQR